MKMLEMFIYWNFTNWNKVGGTEKAVITCSCFDKEVTSILYEWRKLMFLLQKDGLDNTQVTGALTIDILHGRNISIAGKLQLKTRLKNNT